jgi:hypothetical protein
MPPRELMVLAGQLDLYEKFHPRLKQKNKKQKVEKPRHYGSIESEGELLDLNVTWDMATGFPALCGDEICLVVGESKKWLVDSRLRVLRSVPNSECWEIMSIDWETGTRGYKGSDGHVIEENVILTPNKLYLEPRTIRSSSKNKSNILYKFKYGMDGKLKEIITTENE